MTLVLNSNFNTLPVWRNDLSAAVWRIVKCDRSLLNAQVLGGNGKPISQDFEIMLPYFLIAWDLLNILKAFKDKWLFCIPHGADDLVVSDFGLMSSVLTWNITWVLYSLYLMSVLASSVAEWELFIWCEYQQQMEIPWALKMEPVRVGFSV